MPQDLGLNLLSGVAQAMGADTSQLDKRIDQRSADRAATQHEELAAQTHAILQDVSMLQKRRSELDPNSPTYQKDVTEIDSNLHSARQAFTDLYHPEKNPGALAKFGGFLQAHLGGIKKADRALDAGRDDSIPKTPGEARKKFDLAGLDAAAAGTRQNPLAQKVRDAQGIGASSDDARDFALGQKGNKPVWKPFKVGEQVRYYDLNNPQSIPPDATAIAGGAAAPPKVGSFGDFLTREYGPAPTPEQIQEGKALWAKAGAGTTIGTHMITVPQPDGSIKVYQVETTSTKTFPGAGGAPSANIPKTPGEARGRLSAPSGSVKPGDTLGGRLTAPQTTAKKEYGEAVSLDTIAKDVESKPDDAVNQKRLAVALEKASAGRFTQQAVDYIVKSGLANSFEGWANSATTGALPRGVMRQLIDGAHQLRKGKLQEMAAAFGGKLKMQAPTGETMDVPADQIDHYESLGAKVAQ